MSPLNDGQVDRFKRQSIRFGGWASVNEIVIPWVGPRDVLRVIRAGRTDVRRQAQEAWAKWRNFVRFRVRVGYTDGRRIIRLPQSRAL